MVHFALAAVPTVMKLVIGIWVFAAIILVFIVLIQKGKGGGLGSAFGGVGSSLLGTKTGDFLTWVTICIVTVWLLLSVVSAKWFKPQASEYLQGWQEPVTPAPQVPIETIELLKSKQTAESQEPKAVQTDAETQETNIPAVTE